MFISSLPNKVLVGTGARLMEDKVFKALSCETRRRMLKSLLDEEKHISGLARELSLSVPVVAEHINLLEDAGLVSRRKFGRSHVITAETSQLYKLPNFFEREQEVDVGGKATVLEILDSLGRIGVEKINGRDFVTSVNGDEGYYLYEINGNLPDKPMSEYVVKENSVIKLKRLVSVSGESIEVKVNEADSEQENEKA